MGEDMEMKVGFSGYLDARSGHVDQHDLRQAFVTG